VSAPFINVSVRVPNRWRDARRRVNTVYAQASKEAAALTESELKNQIRLSGRVATFTLYNNTAVRLVRYNNSTAWYTRQVYFKGKAAQYAYYADKGREAGNMPFSRWLYAWLDAVGLSRKLAFVIARFIGEHGVAPANFMYATNQAARPRVARIFQEATARLVGFLKGGA
jgi:hypothetical protein